MILPHSLNGVLQDNPHLQPFCFHRLAQLFAIGGSHSTDEGNREVWTLVSKDIPHQEATKLRNQKGRNGWFRHMFAQERHQRSQETVGLRLTIDPFYEIGLSQVEPLEEGIAERRRQLPLQHIAH